VSARDLASPGWYLNDPPDRRLCDGNGVATFGFNARVTPDPSKFGFRFVLTFVLTAPFPTRLVVNATKKARKSGPFS
jgi:hypothetical protein